MLKENDNKPYKLDVYKVIDGTDQWPIIRTFYGDSESQCVVQAEYNYGSNDGYHWTQPVHLPYNRW